VGKAVFVTGSPFDGIIFSMVTKPDPGVPALDGNQSCKLSAEADEELRGAILEMERGDYVELNSEELERWVERGEWPWQDESLD
jgi:hypothetical protein